MDKKYTEAEIKAINDKFNAPKKVVICPRCGNFLQFRSVGSSCEVKCGTKDCLYDCIRGL